MILLKKRHRLSARCIDDILMLLRTLKVKNVPSSWFEVKKGLTETNKNWIEMFICPKCQKNPNTKTICSQCDCGFDSDSKPKSFLSFSIREQLNRIINNNQDLFLTIRHLRSGLTDISDGTVHQTIQRTVTGNFLSLTMNVDGIQPNRNSQQILWPILLVVNELPIKRRFAIENVILGGVWLNSTKPTREEMSLFLRSVVDELLIIERGHKFYFDNRITSPTDARIILIACCCDKPAQALLQFLPEPIAAYGCGFCEVKGNEIRKEKLMFSKDNCRGDGENG